MKVSSPAGEQKRTKLRLSAAARDDFREIDAFSHEQFGADIADAYMRGFRELFDLLRRYPKAGVEALELGEGIRSLTHRKHLILYAVQDEVVLILRLVHGARDAKQALKR